MVGLGKSPEYRLCTKQSRPATGWRLPGGSSRRLVVVSIGIVLVVVAISTRVLSTASNINGPLNAPEAAVPVTATTTARRDFANILSALGTVQSIDSVAVQARVTGPIAKVEFTPGQDIKQGQELFLIDPRPYEAALDQAKGQLRHDEAMLEEAQTDLKRYQTLAQQNSIAKQQADDQAYVVEQDQGTVQVDQANIETAQLNVEFCHIASPIPGRAGALLVDLGNLVAPPSSQTSATTASSAGQSVPGASMVLITQIRPIYVNFSVPQDMLEEIKRGQVAEPLEVDAYSQAGKLLEKGSLTLIDNRIDGATGTVMLQGTFPNADEALWPGEFVRAELIVSTRRNAVTVPADAVMAGPSGSYVYTIGADDRVRRVDVQVAARRGGTTVIASGLSGGEKVVTAGQYRLDDGVKVEIQQSGQAN